jgi:hypothetical protein
VLVAAIEVIFVVVLCLVGDSSLGGEVCVSEALVL